MGITSANILIVVICTVIIVASMHVREHFNTLYELGFCQTPTTSNTSCRPNQTPVNVYDPRLALPAPYTNSIMRIVASNRIGGDYVSDPTDFLVCDMFLTKACGKYPSSCYQDDVMDYVRCIDNPTGYVKNDEPTIVKYMHLISRGTYKFRYTLYDMVDVQDLKTDIVKRQPFMEPAINYKCVNNTFHLNDTTKYKTYAALRSFAEHDSVRTMVFWPKGTLTGNGSSGMLPFLGHGIGIQSGVADFVNKTILHELFHQADLWHAAHGRSETGDHGCIMGYGDGKVLNALFSLRLGYVVPLQTIDASTITPRTSFTIDIPSYFDFEKREVIVFIKNRNSRMEQGSRVHDPLVLSYYPPQTPGSWWNTAANFHNAIHVHNGVQWAYDTTIPFRIDYVRSWLQMVPLRQSITISETPPMTIRFLSVQNGFAKVRIDFT
jgi:hypothetical protein